MDFTGIEPIAPWQELGLPVDLLDFSHAFLQLASQE